MLASTVERASDLLKVLSFPYGVVTGVMLKYSFDWSSQNKEFDTLRSWLALGLALGSLVFSGVLLILFVDVASDSLGGSREVEPTLVIFYLVTLVIAGGAAVSAAAVTVAVRHILDIREGGRDERR